MTRICFFLLALVLGCNRSTDQDVAALRAELDLAKAKIKE